MAVETEETDAECVYVCGFDVHCLVATAGEGERDGWPDVTAVAAELCGHIVLIKALRAIGTEQNVRAHTARARLTTHAFVRIATITSQLRSAPSTHTWNRTREYIRPRPQLEQRALSCLVARCSFPHLGASRDHVRRCKGMARIFAFGPYTICSQFSLTIIVSTVGQIV